MNRHFMVLMKRIKRVAVDQRIIFIIKMMIMRMMIMMLICRNLISMVEVYTILWEKKWVAHQQERLKLRLHIYLQIHFLIEMSILNDFNL